MKISLNEIGDILADALDLDPMEVEEIDGDDDLVQYGLDSISSIQIVCLGAMILEPIGTNHLPKSVFGLFERFSTISEVIFNAILGMYLFNGKFDSKNEIGRRA